MANIVIYDGSANFIAGEMTPFGFYDDDLEFQKDAPKVADFCARKLGFPMMDVELQSGSFFACFEEAVTTYGTEVYQQQIAQSFSGLQGGIQGEAVNTTLIRPSLQNSVRVSKQYGMEAGVGGETTLHSGMLDLTSSIQDYDLQKWATSQGVNSRIEIRKIYYEAPPAIQRFFDPYAGTGTGIQSLMDAFDFGSFSPGVNFLLMPASFDILKTQAIEFNDQIRRSAYSFEVHNNQLRIFPIPKESGSLKIDYYIENEKRFVDDGLNITSSAELVGGVQGSGGSYYSNNDSNLITNISNVPTNNPIYSEINSIGRQWIFKYASSLAKEMLAYVRGKYQTVPVPGAEATLNQADLLADVRSEKEAYVTELREILNTASISGQLENQANNTKFLNDALGGVPMTIYVG
tara:strand:+ start:3829 stop:5043 length:1215 start_codon:yes stop_codon:yes gene_type:complete